MRNLHEINEMFTVQEDFPRSSGSSTEMKRTQKAILQLAIRQLRGRLDVPSGILAK
jgi:hypothetical protein